MHPDNDESERQDRDHRVDPLQMKWTASVFRVTLKLTSWENFGRTTAYAKDLGALMFLSCRNAKVFSVSLNLRNKNQRESDLTLKYIGRMHSSPKKKVLVI